MRKSWPAPRIGNIGKFTDDRTWPSSRLIGVETAAGASADDATPWRLPVRNYPDQASPRPLRGQAAWQATGQSRSRSGMGGPRGKVRLACSPQIAIQTTWWSAGRAWVPDIARPAIVTTERRVAGLDDTAEPHLVLLAVRIERGGDAPCIGQVLRRDRQAIAAT
jgi:hypothetical protein